MKAYSQNGEDLVVLKYFGDDYKGTFLSCGENDGVTLSNVRLIALKGWRGTMIEPSNKAFGKLQYLYRNNNDIFCMNVALGDANMITKMYESSTHLHKGDTSLLSTLNKADYEKWKATTDFRETEVEVYTVETMLKLSPYRKFDFISIDAEGNDLLILSQMNLTELECKCLCIEWNGDELTKQLILTHCSLHGLNKILLQNAENLLIGKE